MTKITALKAGALAIIAISSMSTASFAASQNFPVIAGNLANSLTNQFKSNKYNRGHNFLLYKYILDAGARANGTKRKSTGGAEKHASWCARWNKTYDPSSNTIAGFGDARLPCISPYGK